MAGSQQQRWRLPNSNSESSMSTFLNSKSSVTVLGSSSSDSLILQRRHSEGELKLPPIFTKPQHAKSNTMDDTLLKSRKKKHSKSSTRSRRGTESSESHSRKSSRSSFSRSSSLGSIASQQDDTFVDDTVETCAESSSNIAESATFLQPLYESPEMPSPVMQSATFPTDTHLPYTQTHAHNPLSPSDHSPLSSDRDPTMSGLFYSTVSTQADEESVTCETVNPTQETIEGAGMYDQNINRLPDLEHSTPDFREAEDRELQGFSDTLKEMTAMIVQDNIERVKQQCSKVITRYREQCATLKSEHEAEKKYLERQVELEKNKNIEGVAIWMQMGLKLDENRATLRHQMEALQNMQGQYQVKKEQVTELRENLHKSEEELRRMRESMAEQKKEMSELVPSQPVQAQLKMLSEMRETQAYLDSIIKCMPDEERIKNELAIHFRALKGRPFTTGMLQKEPKACQNHGTRHKEPKACENHGTLQENTARKE